MVTSKYDISKKFLNIIFLNNEGFLKLDNILSPSLIQVTGIQKVNRNIFSLKDGNSIFADVLMYYTGYLTTFPFLDKGCGITIDDDYVSPIYKYTININHPSMCFLGISVSRLRTFLMMNFKVC